jgi:L-amino acid N-acyltransferase YncA
VIREATSNDAVACCDIYNHFIATSICTFEEDPLTVDDMQQRMQSPSLITPWLVAEEQGTVQGYAYAGKWNPRSAYRHSAECSVYLHYEMTGQGLGRKFYETLIGRLREQNFHCAMGGISIPNPASIALHENLGFEKVAHYKQVGWKMGQWVDVGYWQLMLGNGDSVDQESGT